MANLRTLKLCNNRLLTLPEGLYQLTKLRTLDLSHNKLTLISPGVCTMRVLADLRFVTIPTIAIVIIIIISSSLPISYTPY